MKLKRLFNPRVEIERALFIMIASVVLVLLPWWLFILSIIYGMIFENSKHL